MKVLVVQLARFGDIVQTIPVANALKRNPEMELHFLCRQRFSDAANLCPAIDQLHVLDTKNILAPIIMSPFNGKPLDGDENSLARLTDWLDGLREQKFDRIINLSFSPISSFLVHYIACETTLISGYTRHSDGYLHIPDDSSAYFYAQVGINKNNRIHISDLFGLIANVEYQTSDWTLSVEDDELVRQKYGLLEGKYVVVHIGASQKYKAVSESSWIEIILSLNASSKLVLLGVESEAEIAEAIEKQVGNKKSIINLVGKTSLFDLPAILKSAELLVGCDSLPIHICSLVDTPVLNLSFSSVNFWETGPLSKKSSILWYPKPVDLDTKQVAYAIDSLLVGEVELARTYSLNDKDSIEKYKWNGNKLKASFPWNLIKAIYLGHPFPVLDDINIYRSMVKFKELVQIVIHQLSQLGTEKFGDQNLRICQQVDSTIDVLLNICPELEPMIRWMQTEKLRIPPGDLDEIYRTTLEIYKKAVDVMNIYLGEDYEQPSLAK